MIVVIAILGILAAIAIPRLTGFQEKAKASADIATYETINSSIAILVADSTIKGNVTVERDDKGVITVKEGETDITDDVLDGTTTLKLDKNASETSTWTIANGEITPPGIHLEDSGENENAVKRGQWK